MKDYSIWAEGMIIGYLSERGLRAKDEKQALRLARKMYTGGTALSVKVVG